MSFIDDSAFGPSKCLGDCDIHLHESSQEGGKYHTIRPAKYFWTLRLIAETYAVRTMRREKDVPLSSTHESISSISAISSHFTKSTPQSDNCLYHVLKNLST